MLFIEYDVNPQGEIELVGLINAVEEHGLDGDGAAWLAWRVAEFDDRGWGCAGVPPAELSRMEETESADELRAIVERIVVADRTAKQQAQP